MILLIKNLENIANLDKLMVKEGDDDVIIGVDGESIILDTATNPKKIEFKGNSIYLYCVMITDNNWSL